MADPKFFEVAPPLSVADIAALTGAHLGPGTDTARKISGVAPLEAAGPGDATFFNNSRRFADALAKTNAGLCFCDERQAGSIPPGVAVLIVPDPRAALAAVASRLYPGSARPAPVTATAGVSPGAHVDRTARLEAGARVEVGAVIGAGAEIGRDTLIGPNAVIGPGVRIGRDAAIGANVTITNALIGNRVVIQPGVRIGQDGFGFVPGPAGHTKMPQIGRVIIQDDVAIGANTTIDRGSSRDTIVGEGTKIDNLVQVAHNVVIGRHCLIAGQAGISGSVTIGDFVLIGGQAGLRDNVTIGNGVQVAAMAGVHMDIPPGERWVGIPAQPMAAFRRELLAIKRLTRRSDGDGQSKRAESKEPDSDG